MHTCHQVMRIKLEVPISELIDKITIAQIRRFKTKDYTDKSRTGGYNSLTTWLSELTCVYEKLSTARTEKVKELFYELHAINDTLWDLEDSIRLKERDEEFDELFITMARSIYKTNDRRSVIKADIDKLTNSFITEQKHYEQYNKED